MARRMRRSDLAAGERGRRRRSAGVGWSRSCVASYFSRRRRFPPAWRRVRRVRLRTAPGARASPRRGRVGAPGSLVYTSTSRSRRKDRPRARLAPPHSLPRRRPRGHLRAAGRRGRRLRAGGCGGPRRRADRRLPQRPRLADDRHRRHLRGRGPRARRRPGLSRRHRRRRVELRPAPVLRERRPVHVQRLQLVLRRHVAAERLRLLGRGHRPRRPRPGRRAVLRRRPLLGVRHRAALLPRRHEQLDRQRHVLHDPARRRPRRHPARRRHGAPARHAARARGARRLGEAGRRPRVVGETCACASRSPTAAVSRSPSKGSASRCAAPPARAPTWSPTRRSRWRRAAARRHGVVAARHGRPLARLDRGGARRRAQPRRREAGLRLPRESLARADRAPLDPGRRQPELAATDARAGRSAAASASPARLRTGSRGTGSACSAPAARPRAAARARARSAAWAAA